MDLVFPEAFLECWPGVNRKKLRHRELRCLAAEFEQCMTDAGLRPVRRRFRQAILAALHDFREEQLT
jgi:hypothetical protein